MSTQFQKLIKRFVWFSGLVLLVFIVVQAVAAIDASGPNARIKELMPVVRAQIIEQPLAPELAEYGLENGRGQRVRLADFPRDHLLFVNFWATWCKPCVDELPSMVRLARKLAGRKFAMIAVSYDEDWADLRAFFNRVFGGVPRGVYLLRDPATREAAMLRTRFGTYKLPETYLIREGRILSRFVNHRDWVVPAMVEFFERLLETR